MHDVTKWLLVLIAVVLVGLLIVTRKPEPVKVSRQTPQEIWQGVLEVSGIKLRLVLKITKNPDGTLRATLDSVDQGAMNLPVDSIVIEGKTMRFTMKSIGGSYEGTLNEDKTEVSGRWTQSGQSLPLVFKRVTEQAQAPQLKRPQEPKKPYPYREEDVVFANPEAGITLAGTLTLPKGPGPFPAVVLISGSGQQDRDETVFGHRPFLIIADHLTRQGIAVLRYDDRGVGKSTGDPTNATSADFATDALAAVRYLQTRKEINPQKIGLIGHSEGGLIAPMVAVQAPNEIAFIVLLAGPGVTGEDIILLQYELIGRASGVSEQIMAQNLALQRRVFTVVKEQSDTMEAEREIRTLWLEELSRLSEEEQKALGLSEAVIEAQIKQILSPWFRYFLTYDPRPTLSQVRCPVLVLNGEKDLQVPPSQNLPEIVKALEAGGNREYAAIKLAGLNHLFQASTTGAPVEYAQIEETFSPKALEIISEWVLRQVR